MKRLLLVVFIPCTMLTSCCSYAVALGEGWADGPEGTAKRLGVGAIDLATLPIQAVVIPVMMVADECRQARRERAGERQ